MLNIIKSIFPSFHHDWSKLDPCWLWVSLSMSVSVSAVDRSSITLAISLLLSCHLVSMTENHLFSNYIHSTVKWNVILFGIGLSENSRVTADHSQNQQNIWQDTRGFNANLPLKFLFILAFWVRSPDHNPRCPVTLGSVQAVMKCSLQTLFQLFSAFLDCLQSDFIMTLYTSGLYTYKYVCYILE